MDLASLNYNQNTFGYCFSKKECCQKIMPFYHKYQFCLYKTHTLYTEIFTFYKFDDKNISFLMYWTLLPSIKIRIPWDIVVIKQVLPEIHAFYLNFDQALLLNTCILDRSHKYFMSLMTNIFHFFMFWIFHSQLCSEHLGVLVQWIVVLPENHAFLPKMPILLRPVVIQVVISQDTENKINAFATSCYRVMLNIKRIDHVLNTTVYSMTNTVPLIHLVRHRQLKFLGHILRMPKEEPARRYALYIPTIGKRRPGRPRTAYLNYAQRLLGDNEGAMQEQQIAAFADDRRAWTNLVVACSAADGWWCSYKKQTYLR